MATCPCTFEACDTVTLEMRAVVKEKKKRTGFSVRSPETTERSSLWMRTHIRRVGQRKGGEVGPHVEARIH